MKIKEIRLASDKRPEDIAKALNITVQSYYRYETNKNEPDVKNLIKIADIFGVTLDYLVGRPFANDIGFVSDQEKDLLNHFRQLNEFNREIILSNTKMACVVQHNNR